MSKKIYLVAIFLVLLSTSLSGQVYYASSMKEALLNYQTVSSLSINLENEPLSKDINKLKKLRILQILGNKKLDVNFDSLPGLFGVEQLNVAVEHFSLNSSIQRLSNLQYCSLSAKIDSLPFGLSKLKKLSYLTIWLNGNAFPLIPNESITSVNNLTIAGLNAQTLGNELSVFKNLKVLSVKATGQRLDVLSSLCELSQLTQLQLSCNGKILLPKCITSNSNLTIGLTIDSCRDIYDELPNYSNINSLTISHCKFKVLPLNILKLKSIKSLSISNSPNLDYSDALLKISKLKKIITLYLPSNNLKTPPKEIGALTQLEQLGLGSETDSNPLESLPKELEKLKNLKHIDLRGHKFTEFPEILTKLTQLEEIHINSDSKITRIPESIAHLKNLRTLSLGQSTLTSKDVKKLLRLIPYLEADSSGMGWFFQKIDGSNLISTSIRAEDDEDTVSFPDPYEYIALDKNPEENFIKTNFYENLLHKIVYPAESTNSLDGNVLIRVLVDKNGYAKKVIVKESPAKALSDAVEKATLSAIFPIGTYEKKPQMYWMDIKIPFRSK